jgi:hypothetical protein
MLSQGTEARFILRSQPGVKLSSVGFQDSRQKGPFQCFYANTTEAPLAFLASNTSILIKTAVPLASKSHPNLFSERKR